MKKSELLIIVTIFLAIGILSFKYSGLKTQGMDAMLTKIAVSFMLALLVSIIYPLVKYSRS